MMVTREQLIQALNTVKETPQSKGVADAGMISGLALKDGKVGFVLTVAPQDQGRNRWMAEACENAVRAVAGVTDVSIVLTSERQTPPEPARRAQWNREPLTHVKRLVAVASGKGGVGKSTTAVNLAHALLDLGKKTGLLDADIYGPSIPRMMGADTMPQVEDSKILPLMAHGIQTLSMGMLVGKESALVWRGPQMSKALSQLLRGAAWGSPQHPLDWLLVDMPPGTGDVHLSLAQQAPLDGAIIVTTPQDVAVDDARKCMDMFHKLNVPVMGVIENMSGFRDPAGAWHTIFGEGGGLRLAEAAHVPFLGSIPIDMELRQTSDAGLKYADAAGQYAAIARKLTA